MTELRFAHHAITVKDVDRSVHFYRDLLHWTYENESHVMGEAISVGVGAPGAHLRIARVGFEDKSGVHRMQLIQYMSGGGLPAYNLKPIDAGSSHLGMHVDDVQKVYTELVAQKVKAVSPPVRTGPGDSDYSFFVYDPDGVPVELTSRPTHHAHTVSDFPRAVTFYRDQVGMKVIESKDDDKEKAKAMGLSGKRLQSARLAFPGNDEFIELQYFAGAGGKPRLELGLRDVGCSHLAFGADSVDKAYEELLARGVCFVTPPFHPRPGSSANCTHPYDPDGYFLELVTNKMWVGPLGFDATGVR